MTRVHLKQYLREPLVHFLLIGAGIYVLYAFVAEEELVDDRRVTITAAQVNVIVEQFAKTWGRQPTSEELDGLIQSHSDVQVLYREALAMGMDKGDYVIERRLAQKLELLAAGLMTPPEPTDEVLIEFFQEKIENYRQPDTYTVTQVYFSSDERGDSVREAAETVLAKLRELPDIPADIQIYGDVSMLPVHVRQASLSDLTRGFGQDFSAEIPGLSMGSWEGPLLSGFGLHLVYIHSIDRAGEPDFEALRAVISDDWAAEQVDEFSGQFLDELRSRYVIIVEDDAIEALTLRRDSYE